MAKTTGVGTQIIAMLKEGATCAQIRAAVGCANGAIYYHSQKSGLSPISERDLPEPEEKICTNCNKKKIITDFARRGSRHSSICKDCHNAYYVVYFSDPENKRKQIARSVRNNRKKRLATMTKLWNYYLEHPCRECGESDPTVLDADHRDPTTKVCEISKMVGRGFSWEVICTELQKCDILCAVCHRRRTAKQQGWYAGVIKGNQ